MTIDTSVILTRMQAVSAAVSSLGPALEAAAPSGDFQSALDEANAALTGATTSDSPEPGSTGSASTSPGSTGLGSVDLSADGLAALGSSSTSASFVPSAAALGLSATAGAAAGTPVVTGASVVTDAEQYLGVPYRWGGTDPSTGLDCSGLVQHVYSDLGISLPRTSQEQADVGTPVASLADAQPGDLMFFEPSASGPGHVGIYVGNGEMIDAPHTGTAVQIQRVGQPSEIRRVLPGDSGTGPLAAASSGAAPSGASTVSGTIPASLDVPGDLVPLFTAAAAQHGVPASLLAAVAKQESGFNPGAVSSAGAEGIMQLMPSTAAGLGVNAFDPAQAIRGAAQLLSGYLQQYNGSVPLALAAYNAGPGAVAQYGGIPPYPETTAYVNDILGTLGAGS